MKASSILLALCAVTGVIQINAKQLPLEGHSINENEISEGVKHCFFNSVSGAGYNAKLVCSKSNVACFCKDPAYVLTVESCFASQLDPSVLSRSSDFFSVFCPDGVAYKPASNTREMVHRRQFARRNAISSSSGSAPPRTTPTTTALPSSSVAPYNLAKLKRQIAGARL